MLPLKHMDTVEKEKLFDLSLFLSFKYYGIIAAFG
jgi:hypothetical protein